METYNKIRDIYRGYSLKKIYSYLTERHNIDLSSSDKTLYHIIREKKDYSVLFNSNAKTVDISNIGRYDVDNIPNLKKYILYAPDTLHIDDDVDEEWDQELYNSILELDADFSLEQQLAKARVYIDQYLHMKNKMHVNNYPLIGGFSSKQ